MDGHIRHLHCRYRAIGGDRADASGAVSRLDRLARAILPEKYDAAMRTALGARPDVYILRQVRSSVFAIGYQSLTDEAIADTWADRMAGDVLRTIRDDPGDGANLVRFASEGEFIAQFAAAIADGTAWSRWYFFPFHQLRSLSRSRALRRVLLDHRESLPHVLAILHRTRHLERVVRIIGRQDLDALWNEGVESFSPLTSETLRPLFAAAVDLIQRLGLWSGSRDSASDPPVLFDAYLATGARAADWTDRRELAIVVLEIVRFLAGRDVVLLPMLGQSFESQVSIALSGLDWLDVDHLRTYLIRALSSSVRDRPRPSRRQAASARELTSRQQALIRDVMDVMTSLAPVLDTLQPAGSANRVRVYAAVIDRAPQWADDELVKAIIGSMLIVWAWTLRSDAPSQVLERLNVGSDAGPRVPSLAASGAEMEAVRFVLDIAGDSAVAVLRLLVARRKRATNTSSFHGRRSEATTGTVPLVEYLQTKCAGVFLLSRAVLDMRLPALIAKLDQERRVPVPLDILLISLALRWAGPEAATEDEGRQYVDHGAGVFAGANRSLSVSEVRDFWSRTEPATHAILQDAVFETLAGLRVLSGSRLHLHAVPVGGSRRALIAATESPKIWPLGLLVDRPDMAATLRGWLDAWGRTFGSPPSFVVADDEIGAIDAGVDIRIVGSCDETIVNAHVASREELVRSLNAISTGQFAATQEDVSIGLLALSILRLWSRWLGHFAESSVPYILSQFIRRPGRIQVDADGLIVGLEARPLDVVLEMAGYLDALPAIPWLGGRSLRFERIAEQ